jgi:hypothetical protein
LVVVDEAGYRQAQLYASARLVDNPGDYFSLLEKAIGRSTNTNDMIPYMEIKNAGGPVVIELTPKHNIAFRPGEGLSEQTFS